MKWANGLLVAVLGMSLVAVGCKSNKKPSADASPSVSDLNTAPPAAVPAYTPPTPVEPAVTSTPTVVTPSPVSSTGSGTKYTVKKGDTLWKIASSHYGDGKQYTKIISANPGLKAETLKAGQTITLP